jgi:hypothetical protein
MNPIVLNKRARDITGGSYGRLSVLAPVERDKHGKIKWLCRCDCGKEIVAAGSDITTGHTTSCGCSRIGATAAPTHGMYGTTEYNTWRSMNSRCYNQNSPGYKYWGGRGITVCDEWRNSFSAFYSYMGARPEGMSIERIDNAGNYEPGNVRWATAADQNRNKRAKSSNPFGVAGVREYAGKFRAAITRYGDTRHLGTFDSPWDAICARKSAELKYA